MGARQPVRRFPEGAQPRLVQKGHIRARHAAAVPRGGLHQKIQRPAHGGEALVPPQQQAFVKRGQQGSGGVVLIANAPALVRPAQHAVEGTAVYRHGTEHEIIQPVRRFLRPVAAGQRAVKPEGAGRFAGAVGAHRVRRVLRAVRVDVMPQALTDSAAAPVHKVPFQPADAAFNARFPAAFKRHVLREVLPRAEAQRGRGQRFRTPPGEPFGDEADERVPRPDRGKPRPAEVLQLKGRHHQIAVQQPESGIAAPQDLLPRRRETGVRDKPFAVDQQRTDARDVLIGTDHPVRAVVQQRADRQARDPVRRVAADAHQPPRDGIRRTGAVDRPEAFQRLREDALAVFEAFPFQLHPQARVQRRALAEDAKAVEPGKFRRKRLTEGHSCKRGAAALQHKAEVGAVVVEQQTVHEGALSFFSMRRPPETRPSRAGSKTRRTMSHPGIQITVLPHLIKPVYRIRAVKTRDLFVETGDKTCYTE